MDRSMPAARQRLPKAIEVYWLPRPEMGYEAFRRVWGAKGEEPS
jgi:hypothetical protein